MTMAVIKLVIACSGDGGRNVGSLKQTGVVKSSAVSVYISLHFCHWLFPPP